MPHFLFQSKSQQSFTQYCKLFITAVKRVTISEFKDRRLKTSWFDVEKQMLSTLSLSYFEALSHFFQMLYFVDSPACCRWLDQTCDMKVPMKGIWEAGYLHLHWVVSRNYTCMYCYHANIKFMDFLWGEYLLGFRREQLKISPSVTEGTREP